MAENLAPSTASPASGDAGVKRTRLLRQRVVLGNIGNALVNKDVTSKVVFTDFQVEVTSKKQTRVYRTRINVRMSSHGTKFSRSQRRAPSSRKSQPQAQPVRRSHPTLKVKQNSASRINGVQSLASMFSALENIVASAKPSQFRLPKMFHAMQNARLASARVAGKYGLSREETLMSDCLSTVPEDAPTWRKKIFLEAGLYSNNLRSDTTAVKDGQRRTKRTRHTLEATEGTQTHTPFKMSEPMSYGQALLSSETDFTLPYPIWAAYEEGLLDKPVASQRFQQRAAYTRIKSNIFVERKPERFENRAICSCKSPADGSLGCADDCFNRMMFYECSPKLCPCGEQCSNQRFQRKEGVQGLEVFWSHGCGFGLRTLVPIEKGRLIIEYRGEVISHDTCIERMKKIYRNKKNFYFLDYGRGEVLDAGMKGTDARFINHSCSPNCHIEKWSLAGEYFVGIFASQDIPANTELSYDYNFSSFSGSNCQICHCGSEKCRGVIGQRRMADAVKNAAQAVGSNAKKLVRARSDIGPRTNKCKISQNAPRSGGVTKTRPKRLSRHRSA